VVDAIFPEASRYCSGVVEIRPARGRGEEYIHDLVSLIKTGRFDVVLPFSHIAVGVVCSVKDEIEKYARVPFPSFDVFMVCHDKERTVKRAQEAGVPTPRTWCPETLADVRRLATQISYPAVVKARMCSGVAQGLRIARDPEGLARCYQQVSSTTSDCFIDSFGRPLIQEFIPGQIHDAVFLADHGDVRAGLTQVRRVTYPWGGGVGAVNTTTSEPRLLALGKKMLEAVGWHGPTQCEFMRDDRDGEFKLLEVNPKFWGTLDLSIQAGVNFPLLACELAMGRTVSHVSRYRKRLTYRWILQNELFSVWQSPRRLHGFCQFVARFFDTNTVTDFCVDDLGPGIRTLFQTFVAIARKQLASAESEP